MLLSYKLAFYLFDTGSSSNQMMRMSFDPSDSADGFAALSIATHPENGGEKIVGVKALDPLEISKASAAAAMSATPGGRYALRPRKQKERPETEQKVQLVSPGTFATSHAGLS